MPTGHTLSKCKLLESLTYPGSAVAIQTCFDIVDIPRMETAPRLRTSCTLSEPPGLGRYNPHRSARSLPAFKSTWSQPFSRSTAMPLHRLGMATAGGKVQGQIATISPPRTWVSSPPDASAKLRDKKRSSPVLRGHFRLSFEK